MDKKLYNDFKQIYNEKSGKRYPQIEALLRGSKPFKVPVVLSEDLNYMWKNEKKELKKGYNEVYADEAWWILHRMIFRGKVELGEIKETKEKKETKKDK